MQTNVTDLLDCLEAPDMELPEAAGVSTDKIKETVMNDIRTRSSLRGARKHAAAIPIAAALALALSTAAFAAANHAGFFDNVFGTGVEGQEAYDRVLSDGDDGGLAKTEHQAAIEREDVDQEAAEALIGGAVADIGETVGVGSYTFTVESAVFDENGIGAVTVLVENPDGLNLSNVMNGVEVSDLDVPVFGYSVTTTADSARLDERSMLVADSLTDTQAEFVCYVVPSTEVSIDSGVDMGFFLADGFDESQTASVHIPTDERAAVRELACDSGEASASISSLGLVLSFADTRGAEPVESNLVVRYADGSEYVVKGDDLVNYPVACMGEDMSTVWFAFNRLVDADNVAEVHVAGRYAGLTEDPADAETFDIVLS